MQFNRFLSWKSILFLIDGDYSGYNDVVNRINVMDAQLGEYNNGELQIDWYDVLDISLVRIHHQLINEGRANADVFHKEDFDPYIDKDYHDDGYMQRNTKIAYTKFDLLLKLFIWNMQLCN